MKHVPTWLKTCALSFALPLASLPQTLTAEGEISMQDQAILTAIEAMTSAFEAGNMDRVMQSYEPEAAIAFEPGQPISDAAMARAAFEGFAQVNPEFTYSGHEVIRAGDIALHIAPWSMVGQTPDGQEIQQSGLSVAVLRQQSDGSWRMVIDNPHGAHLMQR
jgi:ketosteroid isomerase-like protein